MTVVGELALWVALFLAVWGSVASFGGAVTRRPEVAASGVRSVCAAAAMITLACLGLWTALLSRDFSLEYVASHTTLNPPTPYVITAFWAGPSGGMLSFALALSLCATAGISGRRRPNAELLPWVVGSLAATLALVLIATCLVTYPYGRVEWVPAEGTGLHPRLQTPLALPFYVVTYGAYGAAAVSFALAVGAVATRAVNTDWYSAVGRWSGISWWLLTASIALRMRWTYLDPISGGLWRPDAAQLAGVAAWLLGFALVRTIESRSPSPRSAASLALTVFSLALIAAVIIPRPPGPPSESFSGSSGAVVVLVGFAVVAAVGIYSGVMRLPRGQRRTDRRARRPSVASLVVYAGFAVLLAGLVAQGSWAEHTVSLRAGGAAELSDPFAHRWRFISQGMSRDERMNYLSTGVALEGWRDARRAGIVSGERRQYLDSMQRPTFEPTPVPGIRSTPALDLYVVLDEVRNEVAQLRIGFRPLVACVWAGWSLITLGGLLLAVGAGRRSGIATQP